MDCNGWPLWASVEYPFLFNAVAFDHTAMEWVVVGRVRLDSQSSAGYALCYKKCRNANENFELGLTLQGIVTDWSDAEIRGLKTAVRKNIAEKLLKGCKVHWQQSCERVAEKVLSSQERGREKIFFCKLPLKFRLLTVLLSIIACFEALCGVRPVAELLKIIPTLCESDDARFIVIGHVLNTGHSGRLAVIT